MIEYVFWNPVEDDDTFEYSATAQSGHLCTQYKFISDEQFECVKLFTKIDTCFSDLL